MLYIFILFFLILGLVVLLWQFSNILSVVFGSPYVGAGRDVIKKALELAEVKRDEVFYDLGCGKGDALVAASKMGAKATGFEISPYYYIWAKIKTLFRRNISLKYQNIKKTDISRADVVYCYLLPEFLEKLAPKFKRELSKKARLISISFKVPGLKLVKKEKFANKTIYIYEK